MAQAVIFLGLNGARAYMALDLSSLDAPESHPELAGRGAFRDLREVGPLMGRSEAAILAYARGTTHWHRRHGFCGVCGSATRSRSGGHVRVCTNTDCGAQHFPRTDPAVIMLVHDGGERCVLGRQKIWLPGMHSTLAGFVEPGESLEESVAREIKEEVGLDLDLAQIAYHSSQPWPFPSSLMLGFHARCQYGPRTVDPRELESARWATREELRQSPEDDSFRLPRKDSIARRLIEDWLAEE
jgi:NAD+ diphosphatase